MKLIKLKGIYSNSGEIELENNKSIKWKDLTDQEAALLPKGSILEISVSFNESVFLSGKDGIVWGSYDARQIDVIKNALLAQNIIADVSSITLGPQKIFLLSVADNKDVSDASEFIWMKDSGLRLNPDWTYPLGDANSSFERWLNGQ